MVGLNDEHIINENTREIKAQTCLFNTVIGRPSGVLAACVSNSYGWPDSTTRPL